MIKHSDFMTEVANAFGESVNSIKLVHRLVREAGIVEGRRGRHAPARSPHDAGVFLCWIGITDKPSEAVEAVKDFGGSPSMGRDSEVDDLLRPLGLAAKHSLLDFLAALVKATAEGIDLPPYNIVFEPGDLSVTIDFGLARRRYGLDTVEDADHYYQKHGKAYRVTRILPKSLIERIAAAFANDSSAPAKAA